jgi:hypothetical protein
MVNLKSCALAGNGFTAHSKAVANEIRARGRRGKGDALLMIETPISRIVDRVGTVD